MKFKVTRDEFGYLVQEGFIPHQEVAHVETIDYELSPEGADQLRDKLGERLQDKGFDVDYNLTSEGKILQRLFDRFFIG